MYCNSISPIDTGRWQAYFMQKKSAGAICPEVINMGMLGPTFDAKDPVDKLNLAVNSQDADAALALLKEAGDSCAVKALAKAAATKEYSGHSQPFSDYSLIANPAKSTETIMVSAHNTHASRLVAGIELPVCEIKKDK